MGVCLLKAIDDFDRIFTSNYKKLRGILDSIPSAEEDSENQPSKDFQQ
jgi:hypothetical protein